MESGLKFSVMRTEFEIYQMNMRKGVQNLTAMFPESNAEPTPEVKDRATTVEESEKARDVVSKCLILMKILVKYDEDKKTNARAILKKSPWFKYAEDNIGFLFSPNCT